MQVWHVSNTLNCVSNISVCINILGVIAKWPSIQQLNVADDELLELYILALKAFFTRTYLRLQKTLTTKGLV